MPHRRCRKNKKNECGKDVEQSAARAQDAEQDMEIQELVNGTARVYFGDKGAHRRDYIGNEVDMRGCNDIHLWVKNDKGIITDMSFVFSDLISCFQWKGEILYREWDVIPPYYRACIESKARDFCDMTRKDLAEQLSYHQQQRGNCLACAILQQKLDGGTLAVGSVGVKFKNKKIVWDNGNGRNRCDRKYACEAPHESLAANTKDWERYFEVMDSIQVL
tara:strand:- start:25065 stop:25721 length:657 start_codon:yes stop_codon:yes gene_type:complete